jgi:transcriptional regulator with XRE-family HTH domain
MESKINIHQKVKKLRKHINLSQVEFSKRVGIGLRCLREIEQGKPTVRLDKLMVVLDFLGFTIDAVRKTYPYEPNENFSYHVIWNSKLRLKIRTRDGFKCKLCGCSDSEHRIKYHHPLTVHHIDYDKKNCKDENLISLCKSCHAKTNENRPFWYKILSNLMRGIL